MFHPSFTAWLRCSCLARSTLASSTSGFIQALQLGYVAATRRLESGPSARSRFIQALQLGYVAATWWPPLTSVGWSFIQALQLGYVAAWWGPMCATPPHTFHPSFTAWLRCSSARRAFTQASTSCFIQALQLGYVAGPRARPSPSGWSTFHPSFAAWLRCSWPSRLMDHLHDVVSSKLQSLATLQL